MKNKITNTNVQRGKLDIILGLQFGDEGKGKVVDCLSEKYDIVARFQGGSNAGHTIIIDGIKHVLHLMPSGIFRDECINVIGNGVVIDPISLMDEILKLESIGIDVKSKLYISKRAHLILPTHRLLDKSSEISKGSKKIGSTLKGIGPTYMDKTGRNGIRMGDIYNDLESKFDTITNKHLGLISNIIIDPEILESDKREWIDAIGFLKHYNIIDSEQFLNKSIEDGKNILAEGAQGTLLDIDFGTYPYVTSSNTTISGVISGLGIPPTMIGSVTGIFKAYLTRVGSGPFPTEQDNEIGENIRQIGQEFGSTTGRSRRVGWIDLPLLKYACMINGVTDLSIMKIDVLSHLDEISVCVGYQTEDGITEDVPFELDDKVIPVYEKLTGWKSDISNIKFYRDLPAECKKYIKFIEQYLKIEIKSISIGPDRDQTLIKREVVYFSDMVEK